MIMWGMCGFIAGVFFGILVTALMAAASDDSRRREDEDDMREL